MRTSWIARLALPVLPTTEKAFTRGAILICANPVRPTAPRAEILIVRGTLAFPDGYAAPTTNTEKGKEKAAEATVKTFPDMNGRGEIRQLASPVTAVELTAMTLGAMKNAAVPVGAAKQKLVTDRDSRASAAMPVTGCSATAAISIPSPNRTIAGPYEKNAPVMSQPIDNENSPTPEYSPDACANENATASPETGEYPAPGKTKPIAFPAGEV